MYNLLWRDNGWGLGAIADRKKEMKNLLKEAGRQPDLLRSQKKATAQRNCTERLATPKVTGHTIIDADMFVNLPDPIDLDMKSDYIVSKGEPIIINSQLDSDSQWKRVTWKGRTGYVTNSSFQTTISQRPAAPYLHARQGEGWRRKGTSTADILLRPSAANKSQKYPNGRFWVYDHYRLSKQHIDRVLAVATVDVTQTIAYRQIKHKLDRMLRKSAKECVTRFGILLDIITTNSLIQTGIPHELGNAAYKYIELNHYDKLGLKFVFIGITDNVNCRAARDVFCREHVRYDAHDSKMSDEPKRAFDALDNQHMYCVFPAPASTELASEDVRAIGESLLRPGQYVMPRRTLPPPIKKTTYQTMRQLCSEKRIFSKTDPSKVITCQKELRELCGSDENSPGTIRPATAPPSGVNETSFTDNKTISEIREPSNRRASAYFRRGKGNDKNLPPRPATAFSKDAHEVAKLLRSDPVRAFSEGGMLSTSSGADPVEAYQLMKAARDINEIVSVGNPTDDFDLSSPKSIQRRSQRVRNVPSPGFLRRCLNDHSSTVAIAFGAPWCQPYINFLPKWSQLATEFPSVKFLKLDVVRLTDAATKCWVEAVPTYQIYSKGKLHLNTTSCNEDLIKIKLMNACDDKTDGGSCGDDTDANDGD